MHPHKLQEHLAQRVVVNPVLRRYGDVQDVDRLVGDGAEGSGVLLLAPDGGAASGEVVGGTEAGVGEVGVGHAGGEESVGGARVHEERRSGRTRVAEALHDEVEMSVMRRNCQK